MSRNAVTSTYLHPYEFLSDFKSRLMLYLVLNDAAFAEGPFVCFAHLPVLEPCVVDAFYKTKSFFALRKLELFGLHSGLASFNSFEHFEDSIRPVSPL